MIFTHFFKKFLGAGINRRQFLKFSLSAALLSLPATESLASMSMYLPDERSLSFYNIHTGENLKTTYWIRGEYLESSIREINTIMRDYRTNEVLPIDQHLLDLLYQIRSELGTRYAFHIVSGYRSQKTNALLRKISTGVSKKSLHMYGRAIDIRIPYTDIADLRNAAVSQQAGGVGFYPDSNFVHIDTGDLRYW